MKKTPPRVVPSFDDYYMGSCYVIAARSKDPSTQHGAIVVDRDNIPRGWGYNGVPQKILDKEVDWKRPEKYPYIVHAEENAFDHAYTDLVNGTIYVTGMPCPGCARRIITNKLRRVVYGHRTSNMVPKEVSSLVTEMFRKGGITLDCYCGNMNWLRDLLSSLEIQLPEAF